jgi:hypothetical protein
MVVKGDQNFNGRNEDSILGQNPPRNKNDIYALTLNSFFGRGRNVLSASIRIASQPIPPIPPSPPTGAGMCESGPNYTASCAMGTTLWPGN